MLFDTSSIPVGSTILEASLWFGLVNAGNLMDYKTTYAVFDTSPASNTEIVPTDYQKISVYLLSNQLTYDEIVTDGKREFVLNEHGLAAITPGGITKLGIREVQYDAMNNPLPWYYWQFVSIDFVAQRLEHGNRPMLAVGYLPP